MPKKKSTKKTTKKTAKKAVVKETPCINGPGHSWAATSNINGVLSESCRECGAQRTR